MTGLESLVEKNLVHQTMMGSEPWYVMLEIIREFAEIRLEESDEAGNIRRQHANYTGRWRSAPSPSWTARRASG